MRLRLAAHIGVLDEVELIGPCIEQLRAQGVDEFIVCDLASTDGTRELLADQEGPGFRVIDSSNAEPLEHWRRRNAAAIQDSRADWVLIIDADEFTLAPGGDLRSAFAGVDADVVRLPRYNMVMTDQGLPVPLPLSQADLGDLDLYLTPMTSFSPELGPTDYWLRLTPLPKLAVRPEAFAGFDRGVHNAAVRPGFDGRPVTAQSMVLAHAALTTYPRFARKVAHIREMFRLQGGALADGFAWHWRRWVDLAERGELEAEFRRSRLSPGRIEQLRARGEIASVAAVLEPRALARAAEAVAIG